jgi:hypothetical protein
MLAVLVAFALGFGLGRRRRSALENQGEAAVRRALTKTFPGPAYHLLNHLTLPLQEGTTQIDHVLVARSGIFVIEVKESREMPGAMPLSGSPRPQGPCPDTSA